MLLHWTLCWTLLNIEDHVLQSVLTECHIPNCQAQIPALFERLNDYCTTVESVSAINMIQFMTSENKHYSESPWPARNGFVRCSKINRHKNSTVCLSLQSNQVVFVSCIVDRQYSNVIVFSHSQSKLCFQHQTQISNHQLATTQLENSAFHFQNSKQT